MITFLLNVSKHRGIDIHKQLCVLAGLKADIDAVAMSSPCPSHNYNSRATILLRGLRHGYELEILDSCCSEFRQTIETSFPLCRDEAELCIEPLSPGIIVSQT